MDPVSLLLFTHAPSYVLRVDQRTSSKVNIQPSKTKVTFDASTFSYLMPVFMLPCYDMGALS